MGYIVKIKSYKEIKENDIDQIIYSLPDYLQGPFNQIKKQVWGWPCICDISLPKGNEIIISGAYNVSGNSAENFCRYIQTELDKLGYDTSIYYQEGVLFDEQTTKNTANIKLYEQKEHPDIEEVELKFEYKKFCDAIVDFSDELITVFKKLADAIYEYSKKIEEKRMEEQNNESDD